MSAEPEYTEDGFRFVVLRIPADVEDLHLPGALDAPIRGSKYVAGFEEGDELDGQAILTCCCNTFRYEVGHMDQCPCAGYPPEVLVVDAGPLDWEDELGVHHFRPLNQGALADIFEGQPWAAWAEGAVEDGEVVLLERHERPDYDPAQDPTEVLHGGPYDDWFIVYPSLEAKAERPETIMASLPNHEPQRYARQGDRLVWRQSRP